MSDSGLAFIYQEPCGCVTAVMNPLVPDLAHQLGRWRRYKPPGSISLIPTEEARRRINMRYPKQHQHEQSPEAQKEVTP